MKGPKQPALACPIDDLVILERVLVQWWRLVAFMKAKNIINQAMCPVLYRRIVMAIKMASKKVGTFCIVVLLIVPLAADGTIRSE
jgi:hypothetical protein